MVHRHQWGAYHHWTKHGWQIYLHSPSIIKNFPFLIDILLLLRMCVCVCVCMCVCVIILEYRFYPLFFINLPLVSSRSRFRFSHEWYVPLRSLLHSFSRLEWLCWWRKWAVLFQQKRPASVWWTPFLPVLGQAIISSRYLYLSMCVRACVRAWLYYIVTYMYCIHKAFI